MFSVDQPPWGKFFWNRRKIPCNVTRIYLIFISWAFAVVGLVTGLRGGAMCRMGLGVGCTANTHTHTHTHTEIHTTAEHIVHTGLSVTSNAIQENLKINNISWRVTVSGESEVKWLFCGYFKHKSLDCSVILWGDQVDRLIVPSIVYLKHITLFVLIYKQLVDICGDYWCAFNL